MTIDVDDLLIDPNSIRTIEDFSRVLSKAKEAVSGLKDELDTDVAKAYTRQLDGMGTQLSRVTDLSKKMQANYEGVEKRMRSLREIVSDTRTPVEDRTRAENQLNILAALRPALLTRAMNAQATEARLSSALVRQNATQLAGVASAAGKAQKALNWRRMLLDTAQKIPIIGGLITKLAALGKLGVAGSLILMVAKLVGFAQQVYRRFKDIEESAKEFRVNTGLTSDMMVKIKQSAREINLELGALGISLKDAFASAQSLYEEFQTTDLIKKEDMMNLAKWNANIGLGTKEVAKIKSLFTSIADSTGISVDDSILLGVSLAKAGGVAPSAVMKDIAEASEDALIFMGKAPLQMMKTAVEARKLGTSLKSIADSAKGFLNYQDSITAELEASALLGKSLSFQESRLLAFNKDVLGSRRAALKVIEEAADFTSLDPYTQAAMARAAQMTTEEVIKQTNQRKMLAVLEASTAQKDIDRAKEYRRLLKNIGEQNKENLAIDIKKARAEADKQLRQQKIESLVNKASAAWTRLIDSMTPVIDMVLPTIEIILDQIVKELDSISAMFREDPERLRAFADAILIVVNIIGTAVYKFVVGIRKLTDAITIISDLYSEIRKPIADFFGQMEDGAEKTREKMTGVELVFRTIGNIIGGIHEFMFDLIGPATSFNSRMAVGAATLNLAAKSAGGISYAMTKWLGVLSSSKTIGALSSMAESLRLGAGYFSSLGPNIATAVKGLTFVEKTISMIAQGASAAKGVLGPIGTIISKIFPLFKFLVKWVPIIGWIITGVELITNLFKGFSGLLNSDEFVNANWSMKILMGIGVVGEAIYDTIVGSFVDAAVAIKDWFGFSPSKIGLRIANGFISIKKTLYNSLVEPFKNAYNDLLGRTKKFVTETISQVGNSFGDWIQSIWGRIVSRMEELLNDIKRKTQEFSMMQSISNKSSLFGSTDKTASANTQYFTNSTGTFTPRDGPTMAKIDATQASNRMVEEFKNKMEDMNVSSKVSTNQPPVVNVNTDFSELNTKLDTLIKVTSERLVVNMDSMRISRGLAVTA